ncbi:MAG: hypothetical protein KatS3mg060_3536 [Dehalococcoidia bacterium]|nr:MAG: hypothetical protein KatS3mg060_3536 [Dehalococcoidia bacterium]
MWHSRRRHAARRCYGNHRARSSPVSSGTTEDDLVAALADLDSLNREACRLVVEARFSARAMAASYERVYEAILDGESRWPDATHRRENLTPVGLRFALRCKRPPFFA